MQMLLYYKEVTSGEFFYEVVRLVLMVCRILCDEAAEACSPRLIPKLTTEYNRQPALTGEGLMNLWEDGVPIHPVQTLGCNDQRISLRIRKIFG